MKIFSFLNEPFPDSDDILDNIKGSLWSGFLITVILYLIQPLNIEDAAGGLLFACLPYGIITSLVVFTFQLVSIYVLKLDRETQSWTLWKWISFDIIMILCIAIANILYSYLKYQMDLDLSSVINLTGYTFMIGMVPLALIGSIKVYQNKKRYTHLANVLTKDLLDDVSEGQLSNKKQPISSIPEVNDTESTIELQVGNQTISLNPRQILFVNSMQNYVQVHQMMLGKTDVITLRKTLASLEADLKSFKIERCHRSYLVNRAQISTIKGNAQGLKLYFDKTDAMVPVSRKYVSIFRP